MSAQNIVVHTTVHSTGLATTILAALGVLLALVSLGWQAMSFWLSGSRVSVEVKAGATDGGAGVVTLAGSPTEQDAAMLAGQGMTQPLLAVKVMNSGRAPTSVMSAGLRYTNGGAIGGAYLRGSPELPHRLEAGSEATWYFDANQVAQTARAFEATMKTGRSWAVRGMVDVGGRKKPAISKNNIRVL